MKRAKILADLIEEKWGNKSAFAKNIGMAPTTLHSILSRGVGKSSVDNIVKVCRGLGITTDILEELAEKNEWKSEVIPFKTKKVPMLGVIAAGVPILAQEEHGSYVEVDINSNVDYCLRAKGDSMIDARIMDGDIVFIRSQSDIENGEIAVVLIDDEATLKRVYKNDNGIILKPENSKYPPKHYTLKDLKEKDVKIRGKAILFQSEVR